MSTGGVKDVRRSSAVATMLMATLLSAGPPARAADFPNKPVRIVVGFTAGGPTDIPIRFIADRLSKSIGQPVIVEDKPGAGSMLATNDVVGQPADGYTLLACTYFDPVNTLLYKNARYKVSDIAPITLISRYDYAIAVPTDSPAKTFQELAALGKSRPEGLTYGMLGVGSTQNLVGKRIGVVTGVKMTAVPFKGAADAMLEIVAGRLDMFMGPPLVVMPLAESKQARVIAVTGRKRLPSAPDTPTLTESGAPIVSFAWLGLCARAGTPQTIVDYWNAKLEPILKADDYRTLMEKSGSVPAWTTPHDMQTVIDDTVKEAAPLIEQFSIHLE